MGYEILLCKVESVDTVNKRVLLTPHTPTYFSTIDVTAGHGLKFASSYAPYTRVTNPEDGRVFNTPVGFVNYPQQDDLVLAAVWVTDVSRQDRLRIKVVQNRNMEVIIFAKVSWQFPNIENYDNVLGDRSGAKIHFNHGWLDSEHIGDDVHSDKKIHLPTGHITTVGNRVVRISGKKFLPFGIHSHNLGRGGVDRKNSQFIDESDEPVNWGTAFTRDPTDTNLYNDLLNKSKRGSSKFLEPPCPDPSTLMDIHESGYKHLVEQSGHVRKYMPTGGIVIVGDDSSNTYKKMAFDPQSEPAEKNPGVIDLKFYNADKEITITVDAENDRITIITDAGPAITIDGPDDYVEFEMATSPGLTFTIDGKNKKIVTDAASGYEFTGDVTITGKLDVTGNIESTTGQVKAATKVVTPAVGDS